MLLIHKFQKIFSCRFALLCYLICSVSFLSMWSFPAIHHRADTFGVFYRSLDQKRQSRCVSHVWKRKPDFSFLLPVFLVFLRSSPESFDALSVLSFPLHPPAPAKPRMKTGCWLFILSSLFRIAQPADRINQILVLYTVFSSLMPSR